MNGDPRVSVIMPVFNQERYVARAVESVINQTFRDFELIVVDDGSTDSTLDVLKSIAEPRMKVVEAPHRGFIAALRDAMQAARGHWLARMDSDDVMAPDRLQRQLDFTEAHPDVVLVASIYGFITPNERFLAPVDRFESRRLSERDITLATVLFADPSTMFRREMAIALDYDDDWENEKPLWYKLLARGPAYVLGDPLIWCRFRLGSVSRGQLDMGDTNTEVRRRYDPSSAVDLPVADIDHARRNAQIARRALTLFLQAGDRRAAVRAAARALKADVRPRSQLALLRTLVSARSGDPRFVAVAAPW